MKKRSDTPMPLQIVQYMNRVMPKWTEYADIFVSQKGDRPVFDWDDLCLLPVGPGIAVAQECNPSGLNPILMGRFVSFMYAWRMYKQIFRFDPDMVRILLDTEIAKVPWDTLRNLPYPCVYIQADLVDGYDGFFVWFEDDPNNRQLEVRFDVVGKDKPPLGLFIHKTGDTLQAGLDAGTDMIAGNLKDSGNEGVEFLKAVLDAEEWRNELTKKCLLLTLYLCAENAETDEDPQQKAVHKDFDPKKPKDKYSELRSWNVGSSTGDRIRKYNRSSREGRLSNISHRAGEPARASSPKSPHIRRAHWHHYWQGSRDSEERKMTLKWISPTFIHADEIDGVTINEVEKPS